MGAPVSETHARGTNAEEIQTTRLNAAESIVSDDGRSVLRESQRLAVKVLSTSADEQSTKVFLVRQSTPNLGRGGNGMASSNGNGGRNCGVTDLPHYKIRGLGTGKCVSWRQVMRNAGMSEQTIRNLEAAE
jgi:hypothetical protein